VESAQARSDLKEKVFSEHQRRILDESGEVEIFKVLGLAWVCKIP
jgi:hypothetical protein